MESITFVESLVLKEIKETHAEVFLDRVPETVYLNNYFVPNEVVLPILKNFAALELVDEQQSHFKVEYTINNKGISELLKFFPRSVLMV